MVDGVAGREPLVLHQSLHGYADGHRLLASTLPLNSRDMRTMLSLSDASGITAGVESSGYLTGYPMGDSGHYALARTWPAPEMPRPGCVWTHTVLVAFDDLATIPDMVALLSVFRRPRLGELHTAQYSTPLALSLGGTTWASEAVKTSVARSIIAALYGHPSKRVFSSESCGAAREEISMAIWSQQWPRLRRSFKFCTLALADRSMAGLPFDLQFIPSEERGARSRFGNLFDASCEGNNDAPWISHALKDLEAGRTGGPLRSFLRVAGAEAEGLREAFVPLCELHRLSLAGFRDAADLSSVIALMEGPLKRSDLREVRAGLVQSISARAQSSHMAFAIRNLESLAPDIRRAVASQIGLALWNSSPAEVEGLLRSSEPAMRELGISAIESVPIDSLKSAFDATEYLASHVVTLRPEVLRQVWVWQLPDVQFKLLPHEALRQQADLEELTKAWTPQLAQRLMECVGPNRILEAVVSHMDASEKMSEAARSWLTSAANPNTIAKCLSDGQVRLAQTLDVLLSHVTPDDVPNEIGEDPCVSAVQAIRARGDASLSTHLASWLLARAFGSRSRNPAALILMGLEVVYEAALHSELNNKCWEMLDKRLPRSYWWDEWDRARRLRIGTIRFFIDRDLSPEVFGEMFRHTENFEQFVDEGKGLLWGSWFLRRVRAALVKGNPDRNKSKIAALVGIG